MSPSSNPRILSNAELVAAELARQRTRDPIADAVRAWTDSRGKPGLHATRQTIVRRELPQLADALDRLATKQQDTPDGRPLR